jgi:hypothetical protein
MEFPLSDSYEWRLVCYECWQDGNTLNLPSHECRMDVLIARCLLGDGRSKRSAWYQIRSGVNHNKFYDHNKICTGSRYHMIMSICIFAHSEVERDVWNLERNGLFDIKKFIISNRSSKLPLLSTILDILHEYPVSTHRNIQRSYNTREIRLLF